MPLADQTCIPCRGGVPPLGAEVIKSLSAELPDWEVFHHHHLFRAYRFPDFRTALNFVNRVGAVAEEQGHHPDLLLAWGKVEVTIFTHKIDSLTESDFVLAAKIERLFQQSALSNHASPNHASPNQGE
jgi:4a-hydroxytetrahydrobiopterin dehydratase